MCWSWTNGSALVLIQVELIQIGIRSNLAKTNTNSLHSNSIHSILRKNHDFNFFFPVVITIPHPPDRWLDLFFPVVITKLTQQHNPPDRQLELFFPGRNKTFPPQQKNCLFPAIRFFFSNMFSLWELFPATSKKLTQQHNCIVH